jgi:hypothetical protein
MYLASFLVLYGKGLPLISFVSFNTVRFIAKIKCIPTAFSTNVNYY